MVSSGDRVTFLQFFQVMIDKVKLNAKILICIIYL